MTQALQQVLDPDGKRRLQLSVASEHRLDGMRKFVIKVSQPPAPGASRSLTVDPAAPLPPGTVPPQEKRLSVIIDDQGVLLAGGDAIRALPT